jgi:hypothetical protein
MWGRKRRKAQQEAEAAAFNATLETYRLAQRRSERTLDWIGGEYRATGPTPHTRRTIHTRHAHGGATGHSQTQRLESLQWLRHTTDGT